MAERFTSAAGMEWPPHDASDSEMCVVISDLLTVMTSQVYWRQLILLQQPVMINKWSGLQRQTCQWGLPHNLPHTCHGAAEYVTLVAHLCSGAARFLEASRQT